VLELVWEGAGMEGYVIMLTGSFFFRGLFLEKCWIWDRRSILHGRTRDIYPNASSSTVTILLRGLFVGYELPLLGGVEMTHHWSSQRWWSQNLWTAMELCGWGWQPYDRGRWSRLEARSNRPLLRQTWHDRHGRVPWDLIGMGCGQIPRTYGQDAWNMRYVFTE